MKNRKSSIGLIVLGTLGVIIFAFGLLYLTTILGYQPTLAYIALAVGAVFIIITGVGMVVLSRKGLV